MADEIDYISHLPDIMLIAILSLLPLKDAVKASCAQKRWRYFWRLRPYIEINENMFISIKDDDQENESAETKLLRNNTLFMKFAREWVLNPNIDMPAKIYCFTFVFSNPSSYESEITKFIQFALDHQTMALELDFTGQDWELPYPNNDETYSERFVLPEFVYQYHSLVSLKLFSCQFISAKFENFGRNLKSISLGWINISDPNFFWNITDYCPLLERLLLHNCFGATIYVINGPNLKTLVVDNCVDLQNLCLIVPDLNRFKYSGSAIQIGVFSAPLLEEVVVDFELEGFLDFDYAENITRLLTECFLDAKSITICAYTTQVISLELGTFRLPGQPRAKELTIKTTFHEFEFCGILCLLNTYSMLEKLCFQADRDQIIYEDDYEPPLDPWKPETFWTDMRPMANSCITNGSLKIVEFDGFEGSDHELAIFMFLLKYCAQTLRKITLTIDGDYPRAKTWAGAFKATVEPQVNNHIEFIVTEL